MKSRAGRRAQAGPDVVPLTYYTSLLRRQALVIVGAVLLGTALGLLRTMTTAPVYTSTVSVMAPAEPLHTGSRRLTGQDGSSRRPRNSTMDTEAQLVLSNEVLTRLSSFQGFRVGHDELRRRIKITAPANTRVLNIAVSASRPETAQQGAGIVAEAYLSLREQIVGGVQQRNREALQRRRAVLEKRLAALPGDEAAMPRLTARSRRQALVNQLSSVEKELHALESRAIQSGEVLRSPALPTAPDDVNGELGPATGAGVGLIVGVGIALVRNRRPRLIRTAVDIPPQVQVPVLAELGQHSAARSNTYRRLRNLAFDKRASTVLVAGLPPEAGVRVARGLASLCVEGGARTALVHVDATGEGKARREHEGTADEHASFPVFRTPSGEGDRGFARALAKAREKAQLVVITGVAPHTAEALSMAAISDLTFIVVERERASDRELVKGMQAFEQATVPAQGLVLTGPQKA